MSNQNLKYKILLAGGGSMGHTIPAISVAEEIRKKRINVEFLFVGSNPRVEKQFVINSNIQYKSVPSGKLRRYFSLKNIFDLFKFVLGIIKSFFIVSSFKPDIVFCKGGYAALPTTLVAGWRKIPIVVHESDSTPGLANKIAAKKAVAVCVAFENMERFYPGIKVFLTGNPIREQITRGDKTKAIKEFGLTQDKPVLFFTVASSSAVNFSKVVIESAPRLLSKFQIIQQCGAMNYNLVQKRLRDIFGEKDVVWDLVDTRIDIKGDRHYCILPTMRENMTDAYAIADLVIARSSASTAFELALLGKPALFIPLPTGDSRGDQVFNAKYFQERGAGEVIESKKLDAEKLEKKILEIFETPGKLNSMSQNMKKLAQTNGAKNIAEVIISNLQKNV